MFAIKPLDQTGVSRDGFFDGAVNFISPILLGLIILFSLVQVVEAVGKSAKRPLLRERTFGLVGFGLLTLIFVRLPWPFVGGTLAAQFWNLVLVLALCTVAFLGAWIAHLLRVKRERESRGWRPNSALHRMPPAFCLCKFGGRCSQVPPVSAPVRQQIEGFAPAWDKEQKG